MALEHVPGARRPVAAVPAARRLGVGVIGLHEGRTLLLGLERSAHAFAAAGCDLDAAKIEQTRRELPGLFLTADYAEMLRRPDVGIVAVYTPDPLHARHVIQAFEAGKDVICTKPLVNAAADARAVLEAARRTGRRLLVGQSTRYFEPFLRQRAAFERGDFGAAEVIEAHYVHRMDWFYDKSPWAIGETDWVFLGMSHPLDLVVWYLGAIREVHAYGRTTELGRSRGLPGFDAYVVNLQAEDGRIARAFGHYGLEELPGSRNAIELILYGSRGTSQAQYHDMRHRYTAADGTEVTEDPLYALRHWYFRSEVHGMHYGEFANYAEAFASALLNGGSARPELAEGIEVFCVMEAVRRSARAGRAVQVAEVRQEIGCAPWPGA